ncbi:MAG: hypothetical protein ACXV5U_09025 [Ilumatobacteraceae bacterium]
MWPRALPAARLADVFLGNDLLAWLILALGGALFAGNVMALVKPPPPKEGDLAKAPIGRSVLMGVIGLVAAVWALASLIS